MYAVVESLHDYQTCPGCRAAAEEAEGMARALGASTMTWSSQRSDGTLAHKVRVQRALGVVQRPA